MSTVLEEAKHFLKQQKRPLRTGEVGVHSATVLEEEEEEGSGWGGEHLCIYVYTHTHTHTHSQAHTHVHYIHTYIYVCMYVCMYIYIPEPLVTQAVRTGEEGEEVEEARGC